MHCAVATVLAPCGSWPTDGGSAGPIDHPCALSWPARPITPKQPLVRTNSKTSSNGATAKDQRCGVLPTQLVFKDRSQRPNTTDGVPTRSEGAGEWLSLPLPLVLCYCHFSLLPPLCCGHCHCSCLLRLCPHTHSPHTVTSITSWTTRIAHCPFS